MKQRDSNFELCRIACMFYIVAYHLIYHVPAVTQTSMWGSSFKVVLHIGVLVFVMISGYYGIKPKLRSFVQLALTVAFYNLIGVMVSRFWLGHPIGTNDILSVLFPISKGQYWFITSYAILFLMAPYINMVLTQLDFRRYNIYLLLLGTIVCYGGGIFDLETASGKGFLAFALLYSIGRYVRQFQLKENIADYCQNSKIAAYSQKSSTWLLLYIFTSSVVFLLIAFLPKQLSNVVHHFCFGYNEIGLYIMAILFFMIFKNVKFKSTIINWAATSTLGIYLIHENTYMGQEILYPFYNDLFLSISNTDITLLVHVLFAGGVCLVCIFIDKIRDYIFRIIERLICAIIPKR